jgi:hypothetical protein
MVRLDALYLLLQMDLAVASSPRRSLVLSDSGSAGFGRL